MRSAFSAILNYSFNMNSINDWKILADNCVYEFPKLATVDVELGDFTTVGADLEPETLMYAYSHGYFPMYVDIDGGKLLGWFSPLKRAVFELDNLRVTSSLKKSIKKYEFKINTNFEKVMRSCMDTPREGGWINEDFIEAYTKLHEMKLAHSVETYLDGELVGGLYGVGFAGFFAGESMFSTANDASKVALYHLVQHLKENSAVLLDAQWMTDHLKTLGAVELSRASYLEKLSESLEIDSIYWP